MPAIKSGGRKKLGADIVGFHLNHIKSFDVFWNTAGAYPQQAAGINGLISWFLPLGKMESKGEDVTYLTYDIMTAGVKT